jgi:hypothetical protein
MTARPFGDVYFTDWYVSHSFNQFVGCRGSDLVLVDHGDAYPRAIAAGVVRNFPPTGPGQNVQRHTLWQLPGTDGNNYTGTTVTGFGLFDDGFLVVGNSVPHSNAVGGLSGSDRGLPRNVYLIRQSLAPGAPVFMWLTSLTGSKSGASEPRLVRLDDNRFVVLFTTFTGSGSSLKRTMHYRLLDAAGTVLASKSWNDRVFFPGSDPILLGSKLVWAQRSDKVKVEPVTGYLYTLDVANPADPQLSGKSASVSVKPVSKRSKLRVDVNPNKGKGFWVFQVQVMGSDGGWKPLKAYKTQGKKETRTINLRRGTYRVVVNGKYGYDGATSTQVRLDR